MLRRLFRLVVTAGILGAAAAALAKLLGDRRSSGPAPVAVGPLPRQAWPPLEPDPSIQEASHETSLQPDPEAPPAVAAVPADEAPLAPAPESSGPEQVPAPTEAGPDPIVAADVAWVEPDGDVCPTTHPVKAKLASKIFHVPGGLSYARVKPDRCYRDGTAAEADGLRPAKR